MDKFTIDRNGPWRLYNSQPLPRNWEVLGTVTRGKYDTGALARTPIGVYVQINAGAVRSLDAAAVEAALAHE
ncbi:hypothetical protein ABCS64_11025 [Rhodocyclaceae bacterium Wk13]|uniref:Uncharacterized protein n=2 Tax=Dentiradicibacter hellwigii TaxID=3149053 RepID=A0ABV4UHV1_9RHOO